MATMEIAEYIEPKVNSEEFNGKIPGVPRTVEELRAAVVQGMVDYRKGRVISQAELEKEIATW